MRKHRFTADAAEDLAYWKKHDARKVERIKLLLEDIKANHPKGIGKPEPLRHHKSAYGREGLIGNTVWFIR